MMKPVRLPGWAFRLVRLLFASVLITAFITPSWVLAQSTANPWTDPVNVSRSGGATNPSIVSDADGVVHVVWQDELANFMYTRLEENQWRAPKKTNLNLLFRLPVGENLALRPQLAIYTGPNPLFIASPDGYIYAFWITIQGKLFTSKVGSQDFEDLPAWDPPSFISPQAASFAVAIDARGGLHLAYVRTVGDPLSPPGIYYTRSKTNGLSWSVPALLYESLYLTRLGAGEANLSVATAETEDAAHVFIAWDNRPRKQVFLAQSADGGKSWEQPRLVAGPAPDSGSADPLNIQVGVINNSIVLAWQIGRPTNGLLPSCSLIYQSSRDVGVTWSDPQSMIENMLSCAQSNRFVKTLANSAEGQLYFLTETKSQSFLTAWNGIQWSQTQEQPMLSGFQEPEIYADVVFSCHQAVLLGAQLYIVGCDHGEGGDIWVTSRDIGSDSSWFQQPVWSALSPVSAENLKKIESIELVDTDDGFFHAFFSQDQDRAINYTYWDGKRWSPVNPVLEMPEDETGSPAVAVGSGNELFLVARSNNGMVYLSRATSGNTATASQWSTPTKLEIGHDGEIGSVDIVWDPAGTLDLAYSVPVNDGRGIYLVQSKDRGASWSAPLQVFDGAAAGFEFVGGPSLLSSDNGSLQMVWEQESIDGEGIPQSVSLYYTQSADGGQTFSTAAPAVKEPVAWHEIMTDSKGNLHLLWQPPSALTTVWDQVSMDGGITWQYPQGLPTTGSLEATTTDPVGRLHLVDVGPDALGHWFLDNSSWKNAEPLSWPYSAKQANPVELLAAAINNQGKMMVVVAEPTGEGDAAEMILHYASRTLKLPQQQTAIQPVTTKELLTPTLIPATATPAQLVTPTGLVDNPSATEDQTVHVETNSGGSPIVTAVLPVAVLLLSVMGFAIWRTARGKDQ